MRLTCPCCGAQISAEAWQNDASVRQFMAKLVALPDRVKGLALPYLGLFRKAPAKSDGACSSKGLSWTRALRILSDLVDLVDQGTVHWDGGEARPCSPQLWHEALQVVLQRRPKELENHNYLRRVAWELAEKVASHAERSRETQRRQSARSETQAPAPDADRAQPREDPDDQGERMSPEQWRELKNAIAKMGS